MGAESVLVICPASARINWKREFLRFQTMRRKVNVIASGSDQPNADGVTICSFDLTSKEKVKARLMAHRYGVLIIDEAHFLKGRRSKRTQAILGPTCSRDGGLAAQADHIFALSGTPAPNNPAEVWPLARALFPDAIRRDDKVMDYWSFLSRFCTWRDSEFGVQITGGRNLPELRKRIAPYVLRRRKAEVLTDLPPIRYETLSLSPQGLLGARRRPSGGGDPCCSETVQRGQCLGWNRHACG